MRAISKSRLRQYRRRSLDRRARRRHGSAAIPNLAAGPPKKAPINRWEHRYLGEGRFPETLSALEIEHFFTLDEDELASVRERRSPLNRLALALQVGFLKMTGGTLNSVELIPPEILDHLGRQLDCVPPRIASLRAFYRRRRRTLFEHHASALRLLGGTELIPHAERGLVAYLRREAAAVFDHAELIARARSWLVEHHYLLLRERDIRRLVIAARRHYEQVLFKLITTAVPAARELWVPRLLTAIEDGGISRREWLSTVPSSRAAKGLYRADRESRFPQGVGRRPAGPAGSPARWSGTFRETDDVAETGGADPDQGSASDDRGRLLPAPHAAAADGCEPDASRSPDCSPVARRPGTGGGLTGGPVAPVPPTARRS